MEMTGFFQMTHNGNSYREVVQYDWMTRNCYSLRQSGTSHYSYLGSQRGVANEILWQYIAYNRRDSVRVDKKERRGGYIIHKITTSRGQYNWEILSPCHSCSLLELSEFLKFWYY